MSSPAKPVPIPDERSAPFWAAAAEGRLVLQRCVACGRLAYPPKGFCVGCRTLPPEFDWIETRGEGRLSTWTVVRQALLPAFVDDVPYVVGDVELVEHPEVRILARVLDVEPEDLRIGLPLEADFEAGVPFFRPAGGA